MQYRCAESSELDLAEDSDIDDPECKMPYQAQFALVAHLVISLWSCPLLQINDDTVILRDPIELSVRYVCMSEENPKNKLPMDADDVCLQLM